MPNERSQTIVLIVNFQPGQVLEQAKRVYGDRNGKSGHLHLCGEPPLERDLRRVSRAVGVSSLFGWVRWCIRLSKFTNLEHLKICAFYCLQSIHHLNKKNIFFLSVIFR